MQEEETPRRTPGPDVVALVGEGERGRALLETLLGVPDVEVRYYFDADPDAPGVELARERGVCCRDDGRFDELAADPGVDLILETTGAPAVRAALAAGKHPHSRLLDPVGVRIVSALAEALARVPVEQARYIRQASHQVKSPLSAIQTYVNVILGGYTGELPERTRETVQKIHGRCEAALAGLAKRRMLADLRCAGRGGLETGAAHLDELAEQAVALHRALAERRGVDLRFLALEGDDLVRCDAHKTVLLLSELMENAVVYSHDGGLVEASVATGAGERLEDGGRHKTGRRLEVRVRDHGIGIPERCLTRIFDEDYRADPAVQHHPDGAGLGLTVAREIAGLQRFELTVESDEGHGSVFTLVVPAAPAV